MKFYSFLLFSFIFFGLLVLAQEAPPGVTFPVAELGNCASKAECEVYCDLPENMKTCLDFAEAHNLISPEELAMARKMLELGVTAGPGGCRGQAECSAYCDDISYIDECIAFAERYGLIPPEELEEGKKVAAAIKQGIKPPNCKNKTECDIYCQASENMEECLTFGEAAGLIPPEELADAKKALEAVKKGAKPPACRGKAECDAYCAVPEHLEECITFAEAAGFISPEEAAMVRKTGGKGPGGCRGKEACESYCEDPAHAEECINFALEFGFIPPEEAENARKMLAAGFTGGPGGCKGKEECEAFCNDLTHMEECVNFAEKMGFMSSEDAARARRMAERGINVMQGGPGGCKGKEECEAFCEDPANMEECINFAVQIGEMTPEQAEQAKKGIEMMQRGGPGGCKSEQECKTYCDDPAHGQECINFAVEQGFIVPEEGQRMLEQMRMGPPAGMPSPEGMPPGYGPPPEGMPPEGMPSEGVIPPGGPLPNIPPGFEGKCASAQDCMQYCLQNSADPACQAMMPSEGIVPPLPTEEMMGPPLEGMMPPPELITPPPTESPLPIEAPQSLFKFLKQSLAGLISLLGW